MIALRAWLSYTILNRHIRHARSRARRGPARSPEYRRWIRTFPCAACGCLIHIEAAHAGPHGIGQKSPDHQCIPLCIWDHREGPHALDRVGPAAFQEFHQLRIERLVVEFNREWRSRA